jgi:hypothetical protein
VHDASESMVSGVFFAPGVEGSMEFEVLKALWGPKCRGFLESRCRRLFGARGADASEPMCRWVLRGPLVRRLSRLKHGRSLRVGGAEGSLG